MLDYEGESRTFESVQGVEWPHLARQIPIGILGASCLDSFVAPGYRFKVLRLPTRKVVGDVPKDMVDFAERVYHAILERRASSGGVLEDGGVAFGQFVKRHEVHDGFLVLAKPLGAEDIVSMKIYNNQRSVKA